MADHPVRLFDEILSATDFGDRKREWTCGWPGSRRNTRG